MSKYDLLTVDAFTPRALEGNPCAILPDARGLDDSSMQRIAREMNLSETSYVLPSEKADFRVRYFTPSHELPMAGHPTIATVHALSELGVIKAGTTRVTLEMQAGVYPVTIERNNGTTRYVMRQPAPTFLRTYPHTYFAQALGILEEDLIADIFPQTVSTGTPQLMIALTAVEHLARCTPNLQAIFREVDAKDYFSLHVFARDGKDGIMLRSRHFVDFNGTLVEDPFTGSASGCMAAYCAHYQLIEEKSYAIAQGEHCGRPGVGYIRILGTPPDAIEGIEVGGEAVTVMRGAITI